MSGSPGGLHIRGLAHQTLGKPNFGRLSTCPGSTGSAPSVGETGTVLLIDAANVVGSRPTGWWRDRPGAARAFVERVRGAVATGRLAEPVVVVLEGAARRGADAGTVDGVTVLHAPGSGDDLLIEVAADATGEVTLVSADRALRRRAEAVGSRLVGPGWLIDLLDH
jgi:hypothetical protein